MSDAELPVNGLLYFIFHDYFPIYDSSKVHKLLFAHAGFLQNMLHKNAGMEQDRFQNLVLKELDWLLNHNKLSFISQRDEILRREMYTTKSLIYPFNGLGLPLCPNPHVSSCSHKINEKKFYL